MELRAEIIIAADRAPVWAALTAVARYREWNPFLCEVQGELRPGERLTITLGGSDGYQSRERVRVSGLVEPTELRLRGEFLYPGLIDTEYRVVLAERAEATLVVASARVSGWLEQYTSSRRLTCIARGWVGMNAALKRRVEASP